MSGRSTRESAFQSVSLEVNGKKVGLNPFVKDVLGNIVMATVETLKGVDEEPRQVALHIEK